MFCPRAPTLETSKARPGKRRDVICYHRRLLQLEVGPTFVVLPGPLDGDCKKHNNMFKVNSVFFIISQFCVLNN